MNLNGMLKENSLKDKTILITGGAGYIGSHVAERLIKIKSNIIVLDNLSSGNRRLINKKTIFIKVDLKNIKLLSKVIITKIYYLIRVSLLIYIYRKYIFKIISN